MQKINYFQIALHLIATWLLILALYSFSGLYNMRCLEITQQNGVGKIVQNAKKYGLNAQDLGDITIARGISIIAGILIGCAISVIVSVRNKWSLINCLIVFLLSILISRLGLFDPVMRQIISPENIIYDLQNKYIIQGVLLLVVGILLFSLKKINNLIEKQLNL